MGAAHDLLEAAGPAGRAWLLDKGFLRDWQGGTDDDASRVSAGLDAYRANGGATQEAEGYDAKLAGYEKRIETLTATVDGLGATLAGITSTLATLMPDKAATTETAAPVAANTTSTDPPPADPPAT